MADKTINDLTATTSLNSSDLFELENTGNNSRKITAADLAEALAGLAPGELVLGTYTGNGTDTNVTFSSIPQTYDDLRIEITGGNTNGTTANLICQINGDTSAVYASKIFYATSTTTQTQTQTTASASGWIFPHLFDGATNIEMSFKDYTDSRKKGARVNGSTGTTGSGSMITGHGMWGSTITGAITDLKIALSAGAFQTTCKIRLIGIKKRNAASGATVTGA